jgi:multidrug efflux system membrane fusion protein
MSEAISPRRDPPPAPRPRRPAWQIALGIVLVILVAILLAVGLRQCAAGGGPPGPGGGPPGPGGGGRGGPGGFGGGRGGLAITVGTAKAVLGSIPIQINALGAVTPEATIDVVARVSGNLDRVAFREGQMVKKGQLLAQIDPRPFQVTLDQNLGQLHHDEAVLEQARTDLARYRTLHAQDSIAAQTYEDQAAVVKQDEATVASDRANVASARLNLVYTRITSPVSGRIGLRQTGFDPGNLVTANSTSPMAVVTQLDPMDIVFTVPEDDIAQIAQQVGTAGGGLAVTAYDRSGGTVLAQGKLSTLDNVIDNTTGTVKAKARFANASGILFPSEFVNITMLVTTLEGQVVVPTTAVRHGPQGDFVWVLQADKTVKARAVKVGPGTNETVSIASGLQVGETVITEGGDRLREGAPVILPGQKPGGAAGGPGGHGGHHRHGGGGGAPAN